MQRWRSILLPLGGLPARRVTWGLAALFSLWAVLDVMVLHVSGGLAQSTYDAMVRARFHAAAPDPRVVIIDIDEASLARMGREFGRWPWPRDTLAAVLDHVEKQQPAALVWDIIFSDPDRLNPGGDAAFNEAVRRSPRSHFSVVRLPRANDGASQITRAQLPGLWLTPQDGSATVALIAPALPAVAAARLGFNNGYPDNDGILRRYRAFEQLPDGSVIQSIARSVAGSLQPAPGQDAAPADRDALIAWRKRAQSYPRVSFADVFAQADGGRPLGAVPDFAGKLVIIGATAPSLHDIHPAPLSATQAGVESLATVIDNAVNQRHLAELPRWLQALLAVLLCAGIALWVQVRSVASLAPALLVLPATLLGISYLTLNGSPVFVDLSLAAGVALVFLAVLRYWNRLRREYWCLPPAPGAGPLWVWPWLRATPWVDSALDRLLDAVERHAPGCRVIVLDAHYVWPGRLRWPELARCAAVVGSREALQAARPALEPALGRLAQRSGEPVPVQVPAGPGDGREALATTTFMAWAALQNPGTTHG
ncbi:CHASE2 domain-containing protein [Variovorax terrae]|uniref:CHASE2 domain-containing protein n=1 Tax=Variovorax terrae TaxID=2923278 RepID=A0A9X2ARW8_9BURK|nr:CHASE2 domain-containing protein [Variovorax terrae]MCJ0764601.1 CHASE2 domain-containing protein [Variovorax terrae]